MTVAVDRDGNAVNLVVGDDNDLATIDRVHDEIHRGRAYDFYNENLALASAASMDTLLVTGDKEVHLTLDAEAAGGRMPALIYEGTTTSANGTEIIAQNRNRVFPNTSAAKIYNGPTITDLGTLFIPRQILASSQGVAKITSAVRANSERVFAPNKKYLIRLTSTANGTIATLAGLFYEE